MHIKYDVNTHITLKYTKYYIILYIMQSQTLLQAQANGIMFLIFYYYYYCCCCCCCNIFSNTAIITRLKLHKHTTYFIYMIP